MRKFARPPLSILNSASAEVRSLVAHATFLQQVKSALLSILPVQGHAHIGVADYHKGHLTLIADSGTWATRLRYQQDGLRRALAQSLRLDLDHLEVRVRPTTQPLQVPPPITRRISPQARRQLAESAHYIDDAKLADALSRLSRCGAAGAGKN